MKLKIQADRVTAIEPRVHSNTSTQYVDVEVELTDNTEKYGQSNQAACVALMRRNGILWVVQELTPAALLEAIGYEACAKHWSEKLKGRVPKKGGAA